MGDRTVIIMRGIPGSGKSTRARELVGDTGVIHSTDEYFMKDGTYLFDATRIGLYHRLNFEAFVRSLEAGTSPVIVDNTNIRRRDFKRYVKAAGEAGYDVVEEVIPMPSIDVAVERNTHGIPREAIQRMIDRWQD